MIKQLKWKCSCGREFKFPHQLVNHIGYAILQNDNAEAHAELSQAQATKEGYDE